MSDISGVQTRPMKDNRLKVLIFCVGLLFLYQTLAPDDDGGFFSQPSMPGEILELRSTFSSAFNQAERVRGWVSGGAGADGRAVSG